MSLTNDAVSIFRNRLLSVIQRPEAKVVETSFAVETSPPTAPTLLEQSLLAVARDGANIRREHDAILTKASLLGTLQDDLLAVFDRAYQALEQLAEARSQLARAEAVAKFEHDAREAVSLRLGGITSTYHQTISELEKLRPEAKRLETALLQTSDKLARTEVENNALTEQLGEARAEIDRKRADEISARREHEAAKTELLSANKFVAQKLSEISQLRERCEIAEQAARSSARTLEEARAESAGVYVRLDEERVNFANAQSRIAALETQLKDLGDKFAAARAEWSRNAEQFNHTIGDLKDQLGRTSGLDEAHQRLLTTAQNELSAMRLRLGELETRYAECKLNADQFFARAEGAEAAREQLTRDLLAAKRLQQSMLRRVKPLISALRDKNAESMKLATTLADLEQRFDAYQAEAADSIRSLQGNETQLVAELETERARRVVAEGALAIDRSFRPIETQKRRSAPEE